MRFFRQKNRKKYLRKWCVWQHPVSGQVCCGSRNFIKPLKVWGQPFKEKKNFSESLYAGGKSTFPFLERRQAVFVDFVIFGTTVSDRRTAMMSFLCVTRAFCGRSKEWNRNSFKNRQHILPHCPPKLFHAREFLFRERCFLLYTGEWGAYKICPDGEQWKRFLLQTMFP